MGRGLTPAYHNIKVPVNKEGQNQILMSEKAGPRAAEIISIQDQGQLIVQDQIVAGEHGEMTGKINATDTIDLTKYLIKK